MSPAEKFYQYTFPADYYACTPVPGQPGMREHQFYVYARDIPHDVPHGCNPRHQNIYRAAYAPVRDSFEDQGDMTFHIKNRGITVLADRVEAQRVGEGSNSWIFLKAFIPDNLGNIDGQHSYEIVSSMRDKNPAQMVKVRILEKMPHVMITNVAEGLNTSVQVTKDSLSNQRGRFDPIKHAIAHKPWKDFIAWSENQQNTTTPVKEIIRLMWICHPSLFDGATEKHPNWIYARSIAVYESGFHKNETLRAQLMKMVNVIPQLVDLWIYINDKAAATATKTKSRGGRSRVKTITGETVKEKNFGDLCVQEKRKHFVELPNKTKTFINLRDPYVMIILSAFRALLRINDTTGMAEWIVSESELYTIFDSIYEKLMKKILKQFKASKEHDITSRQPSLWDGVEAEMRSAVSQYIMNRNVTPLRPTA